MNSRRFIFAPSRNTSHRSDLKQLLEGA